MNGKRFDVLECVGVVAEWGQRLSIAALMGLILYACIVIAIGN